MGSKLFLYPLNDILQYFKRSLKMTRKIKIICAALSKGERCYLENISKKANYSGGKRFSRTSIIRTLLEVSRKLNINVSNVKSEKELENRFKEGLRCFGKSDNHK